jgi:hypothetical protein
MACKLLNPGVRRVLVRSGLSSLPVIKPSKQFIRFWQGAQPFSLGWQSTAAWWEMQMLAGQDYKGQSWGVAWGDYWSRSFQQSILPEVVVVQMEMEKSKLHESTPTSCCWARKGLYLFYMAHIVSWESCAQAERRDLLRQAQHLNGPRLIWTLIHELSTKQLSLGLVWEMEESSGWKRIQEDFEKFWLIMEIPPPQYPLFPFIPLVPKQALKEFSGPWLGVGNWNSLIPHAYACRPVT